MHVDADAAERFGSDRRQTAAASTAGEERDRTLFQALTLGVVYQDADGTITAANPAAERILGLSFDQMAGRTLVDPRWRAVREDGTPFPGDLHPAMIALRTGAPAMNAVMGVFFADTDDCRWLSVGAVPLFHPGAARPHQAITTFEDITERRRAEARLRHTRELVEEAERIAHVGSWEWECDAEELTWSDELYRIFGIEPGSVAVTFPWFVGHIHPDDRERVRQTIERSRETGESFAFDHRLIRADRTIRHLQGRGIVVCEDGVAVRMLGSAQDITERVRLERLQQDLIAMVAHDVRSPLTSIKAGAQLMKRRGAYDGQAVDVIVGQVDRIVGLITDLAESVRLDAERLELDRQPFNLVALIHEQARLIEAQSDGHRILVEAPEAPVVGSWDRDRIGQVLQNLLGNAVKYSPVGGDVSVRVARRGRRVQVDIVDHGFGIAPEDQRLIFGRFYRVGAVNGLPGLGLGLFISNMLVEAHGGRIWVESRRHAGSTFSFELPDGVDRPPPAEPPTARP